MTRENLPVGHDLDPGITRYASDLLLNLSQTKHDRRGFLKGSSAFILGLFLLQGSPAKAAGGENLLSAIPDLERYCYYVAGTVGHLLTDLFVDSIGEDPEGAIAIAMRDHAEGFATGLQLTNILKDVTDDCLIMREETFGPVAAITPFDSEDEAVCRANDTEYGLVAYVHSMDPRRIYRLTRALQYGMVAVNRTKVTGAPIPFGGTKQSGLGREGARRGMEEFMEIKYVCRDWA
mgnify:CR=1 FL=1